MPTGRGAILIDARVNGLPGAHGIARSVMKLVAHMTQTADELALRVLVNSHRAQLFSLAELPAHAEVVDTDITFGAVHRCQELADLIKATGAAVLYVPYPVFTPLVRPCPFVVTIHDCTIERDSRFARNWLEFASLKQATRMVLRRAVATTAPSQASLAAIDQQYPGAPNPTLVPNGVEITQFGAATATAVAAARERYLLPANFVLTVGAHRPHKNHETLLRAMTALPTEVSLVIVGSRDPRFPDRLPRLIAELGLESRVRLVPEVAEQWLPAVYAAASVFAFPSLSEGFGMPVLEAMAAGVPVVMSEIPALAEVAGSAAVTVSPRDVAGWAKALASVLADRALSARLCDEGFAVAAAAGWEQGAKILKDLLVEVATGRLT